MNYRFFGPFHGFIDQTDGNIKKNDEIDYKFV